MAQFKRHSALIQEGDYYRLSDPFQNGPYTAWEHVSPDRREALVSVVTDTFRSAPPFLALPLKGLDPSLRYRINGEGSWPGDVLMKLGWPLPIPDGDYQALQLYLEAE
nr:GH36 C-terminal domain-containing protein [uncultured Oscillibacter sp.]